MISETDKARDLESTEKDSRKQAPVFVVGCPRSGTTVLYHMLLSAGGFAIYRSESNVFNLLVPRFRGMRSAKDRQELMDAWLHSMLYRVSGLDGEKVRARVMAECQSGGDFLRIVMGEVASNQGVERWADCTPEHLLFMKEIKRQIPEALFVHMIRDGRDVALSYLKQGWAHPLPWDEKEQLEVTGLYWNWIVGRGREAGKALGAAYREVRFEDLATHPRETLAGLGEFVQHDLDYDKIRSVGIGSVREPNSSFGTEDGAFDPVGRWKTKISEQQLKEFEALAGDRLEELGYALASGKRSSSLRALRLRATYFAMFDAKHWMKTNTPLGRRVRLGRIRVDTPPPS